MKQKPEVSPPPVGKCREASLYYHEGSSDKVYHVRMVAAKNPRTGEDDGYDVHVAWGRRGSTLQTGTKIVGTSLEAATAVFVKTVNEKISKGYKRMEGEPNAVAMPAVTPVTTPRHKTQDSGLRRTDSARWLPQLLNPLPEEQLEGFLHQLNSHWGAQEKIDGKNITLVKTAQAQIQTFNKLGHPCEIAPEIADYARTLPGEFVLHGDAVGAKYHVYNLLLPNPWNGAAPYGTRHRQLLKLCGQPNGWPISPVPLYTGESAIRRFIAELRARNAEGVVFKDLLAPYTAGRPNSGGPQLKCKFYATCSAIVVAQNAQRSVALALFVNPTQGLTIGNVTIPPNHELPAVGTVVEIRYLYAYKGGALYQPVYLGARDDVPPDVCTVEKQALKFKAEPETE